MADISKLRELGKPRYAKEEEYYNEIIKRIEEKMLEVAPQRDDISVVFMRAGHVYGTLINTPNNKVYVDTGKFMKFGKYLHRIEAKYKEEGFDVHKYASPLTNNNIYSLVISWEE